jgi:hypothetical protein
MTVRFRGDFSHAVLRQAQPKATSEPKPPARGRTDESPERRWDASGQTDLFGVLGGHSREAQSLCDIQVFMVLAVQQYWISPVPRAWLPCQHLLAGAAMSTYQLRPLLTISAAASCAAGLLVLDRY